LPSSLDFIFEILSLRFQEELLTTRFILADLLSFVNAFNGFSCFF